MRILLAVAVIVAVLGALRLVLARIAHVRIGLGSGRRRTIEIIETMPLPLETALSVVRVGRRQFALVIGRNGVTPLCELGNADSGAAEPASRPAAKGET